MAQSYERNVEPTGYKVAEFSYMGPAAEDQYDFDKPIGIADMIQFDMESDDASSEYFQGAACSYYHAGVLHYSKDDTWWVYLEALASFFLFFAMQAIKCISQVVVVIIKEGDILRDSGISSFLLLLACVSLIGNIAHKNGTSVVELEVTSILIDHIEVHIKLAKLLVINFFLGLDFFIL